jgi:hypothetical protein
MSLLTLADMDQLVTILAILSHFSIMFYLTRNPNLHPFGHNLSTRPGLPQIWHAIEGMDLLWYL